MPNTMSAKKALKSSARKKQYNNFWKSRIKSILKSLKRNLETKKADVAILSKDLTLLQKVLDKAAKKKVIHKNKANRLKARYAKKITANTVQKEATGSAKSTRAKKGVNSTKESES